LILSSIKDSERSSQ